MSSRRRSRSKDRLKSGSSKLRMDSKPQTPRITDPSLPAGRRREIDNVMKKARASPNSSTFWDKKLLEVEAKDPNRSRSFSTNRSRPKTAPKARSPPLKQRSRPRPPSPSPSPPRRVPRPMTPPTNRRPVRPVSSDKPTDPRRRPPPPPRPRNSTGEVINLAGVKPPLPGTKLQPRKSSKKGSEPVLLTKIKKEKIKRRPGSPGGESSASDESSASSTSPIVATTRLTLSERFGKMAQWSVDRERRDIENMRITKTGGDLKVMIEQDDYLYGSPPRRYSLSPVPAGHYPDELLPSGPSRLAAWDDVRVRYQYYKDLGYLRDLTLDDYVKWEEWWYKYQDWLANERHYEHWLATQSRRRRKRIPATQRLN